MKQLWKQLLISMVLLGGFYTVAMAANESGSLSATPNLNDKYSAKNYPIEGVHQKLGLTCKECHSEEKAEDYSSAMKETCFKCHENYEKLQERTGHLGHNNNIHASPHFTNIDCDLCHKSHQPSQNLCVQCHGQKTMKQLIVK